MPTVRSSRILSLVSLALLLATCLLSSTAAEKSISSFLGASDATASGRALQNAIPETDAPIVEQLTKACNLGDGIESFIEQAGTSGEVCQLAASVVGRGNRRTYEFELTQHHENDLSFQVALQPLEGAPEVSFEHEVDGKWQTQASTEEWSSGNSIIYVVKVLKHGKNRVVLESKDIVSTFSLRIEFFRGSIPIADASALVLKYFKERCCGGASGECTGVLEMVDAPNENAICDSAGNHCDVQGQLTHLDLSESNMNCDLAEIDFLASGLTNLQVLMLNDNNVKGDLSDPAVLKNLASLQRLEILELGNLPGVTGSIPADCPAPFTALIHLGVSNTSVGGTLPACIVNTVHQLEISNTKFEGVFPNIEASSNLRYLIAETDPESASKFSGPFPRIDNAEHLHYANLNNHQFEGTLPLANNVEAILAEGNKLTEVRVLNANRLELLDVAGNQISVLPAELEQLPNLQALHVDGNQLTKLPQIWAVDNLRDFTAARNKIEGKVPQQFGSMPHLRRLVLNNNKFSGDLNDFSEAVPPHSKLQWLDVADNQISGPLFAPALLRLAVFSSMTDTYQTEFDRRATHIFDASNNQLIGKIDQELLQAYEEQLLEGADIHVDFRNNRLECPSKDTLEKSNLGAEAISMLGCSLGGGGGTAKRAVLGVLISVILLGVIAGLAVLYKRRQARKGWFRDTGSAASAYVSSAEASSRANTNTGGWFTGKPDDQKQFAAGLDEPTGGNGVWGFMPFMSRSKQPVSQLLGGGGWSQANTDGNFSGSGSGMQLPVSGVRRDMQVKVPPNGYKQPGAAVTSVELASPMSDVSANSLPRNGGGLIDGGDGDDLSDDGGDGRMRGVFSNSAYAPVAQNPQ